MELHQINLNYIQDEDRILLRVSSRADDQQLQEVRAWLTRHMVHSLWEAMVRAMEAQVMLDKPHAAHATTELPGMEHKASVARNQAQGKFSAPYEAGARVLPGAETPLLITTFTFHLNPDRPVRLQLAPAAGQGFELALPSDTLHAFSKLLATTVARTEWGLSLQLRDSPIMPPSALLN